MGKTNRDRAQKVILGLLHDDPGLEEAYEEVIAAALDKAEKRGAKKERKRILDGTEGYERQLAEGLIEYVDRLNAEYKAPQPKVDAEKVRGLIHNIREHAYNKGRAYGAGDMPGYHRERDILWDAYRALLAALGIE